MIARLGPWITSFRTRGWLARGALISLVVLLATAVLLPWAHHRSGGDGVVAVVAASGVCLLGSLLSLLVASRFTEPALALFGMLAGMAFRMGVPLAYALLVQWLHPSWAEAGALVYLLAIYLVALPIETFVCLPDGAAPLRSTPVPSAKES